jgi:hypothetical protein
MIIQDRFAFGVLMVEPPPGAGAQQKIFVDEFHGVSSLRQV